MAVRLTQGRIWQAFFRTLGAAGTARLRHPHLVENGWHAHHVMCVVFVVRFRSSAPGAA